METDPTMPQHQANPMEVASSTLGSTGVQREPPDKAEMIIQDAFCETDKYGHESCVNGGASSGQPRPKAAGEAASTAEFVQRQSRPGEAELGNIGSAESCDAQGGCNSQHASGGWDGPGPRQMGPMPGHETPHYGQYPYTHYWNPAFVHPGGGHYQWIPPGPAHHQWASPHGQGTHWRPQDGPYFGPAHGMGQGCAGPPHRSGQSEHNAGQFTDMLSKALNGQAKPQDLVSGLLNLNFSDDQFWKGVVIGSVGALIMNSDSVRQVLSGLLGGVFGTQARDDKNTEEAP